MNEFRVQGKSVRHSWLERIGGFRWLPRCKAFLEAGAAGGFGRVGGNFSGVGVGWAATMIDQFNAHRVGWKRIAGGAACVARRASHVGMNSDCRLKPAPQLAGIAYEVGGLTLCTASWGRHGGD
jgi:hypothetical protein